MLPGIQRANTPALQHSSLRLRPIGPEPIDLTQSSGKAGSPPLARTRKGIAKGFLHGLNLIFNPGVDFTQIGFDNTAAALNRLFRFKADIINIADQV